MKTKWMLVLLMIWGITETAAAAPRPPRNTGSHRQAPAMHRRQEAPRAKIAPNAPPSRKPVKPAQRAPRFEQNDRTIIHNYYANDFQRKRRCPPGLQKRDNRCVSMSSRQWTVGKPLPRKVIYYELPPAMARRLGPPPANHKFVRVAQDILLIATGTGIVVDAIDNLDWEFGH